MIKKILIIVSISFFLVGCTNLFTPLCSNLHVQEFSFNEYIISAYTRDCGATTAFSPQVIALDTRGSRINIFILKKSPQQEFRVLKSGNELNIYFDFEFTESNIIEFTPPTGIKVNIFQNNKLFLSK